MATKLGSVVGYRSGIYNGYKVIGTQTLGLRGLVLWLKFNEGSGNIAYDSSFYNNHGTIYGATWTDGKFGKALSFDGVDDYVDCGNDTSLRPSRITYEAWFKANSVSGRYTILRGSHNGDVALCIEDGAVKGQIDADPSNPTWNFVSYSPIYENIWYHAVLTWDGTYARLYVNGELKDTDSTHPGDIRWSDTDGTIIGMSRPSSLQYPFNGTIDEVRIYNRALSENEIKMLYYNRIGAVPSKTI